YYSTGFHQLRAVISECPEFIGYASRNPRRRSPGNVIKLVIMELHGNVNQSVRVDESSLEGKQPALIGHTAGHFQPPELTQSKGYSSSVNIAVHSEYSSSTVLDQIVLLRRKNMVLYSVHLNHQLAAASSQAAQDDVQH
ncbi:hypothetical protein T265_15536, partial [Opisthorchis viverrini]